MLARIVGQHPEYHALIEDDAAVDGEFSLSEGQAKSFFHMAMHVAIHEQTSTDRPSGIRPRYVELVRHFADPHALDHAIMECFGKSLWQAQRSGNLPDEQAYLECVRALRKRVAEPRG